MIHIANLIIRIVLITLFAFFFSITLVVIGDEFGILAALLFFALVAAGLYWLFVQMVVRRY